MQFKELNIIPEILRALSDEHYKIPTPIQEKAIPEVLSGHDIFGCAQTGTGKTAAFAIPTLQLLINQKDRKKNRNHIQALILSPTRELALQIHESFLTYGKHTDIHSRVIFGGVSQHPQVEAMKQGTDVLVATPGRLIDLINQGIVDLSHLKILILDEADQMLDMGFIRDIRKIIAKTPASRQTLLFSATLPKEIEDMIKTILKNPIKIEVTPASSTVAKIEHYLIYAEKDQKVDILIKRLKNKSMDSVLVFTRTKHGADKLVRKLTKAKISALAIHGDKSQGARQLALEQFKNKKTRVLIATDIAARGIDIDNLPCVINFDLPAVPETYIHRIGRTGRSGSKGLALSLCSTEEAKQLKDIEKLLGKKIPEFTEETN